MSAVASLVRAHYLTSILRLPNSKLLGDKTVLDDLIDILLLRKRPFIANIEVSHLLADVWLVHTLRMVIPNKAMAHEALPNKVTVKSCDVGCCCPLLMSARLDLILT